MFRSLVCACALAAVVALVGCGRGQIHTDQVPEDRETRLGDCPVDLAALLALPRSELAKLADEKGALIDTQREALRHQQADELMLPKLAAPRTVAVFHKAKFDPNLGVSLPEYVKRDKTDGAIALHFARFGDHAAAVKFIGDDPDVGKAVNALKTNKDYPAEWTRLVSLTLIAAQNKLAVGDPEGAREIVGIHRQLATVLDEKAAAGPLGAALLPAGRRAIAQAAKALRGPRWNKTALADDLDQALTDWGNPPAPPSILGLNRDEAERLFASKAVGRAIASADLDRARDLLSLPLPTEAAQSVTALLDAEGRVAEVVVAYRGKLETLHPEEDHLAYHLDEAGITASQSATKSGLQRKLYVARDHYEINSSRRGGSIGALVRINGGKSAPAAGLRDLGAVSLDRGFEANRTGWAPSRPGPVATVEDKEALTALVAGTPLPPPTLAILQRDKADDVVQAIRLTWSAESNNEAGAKLLPALLSFGPAALEAIEDNGGGLCFRWQDGRTKAEFRLPLDDKPPVLSIEDATTAADRMERVERARQRDERERVERLAAGKPRLSLPRSPGKVNDFSLEKLELGQSRKQAQAALPRGKDYRASVVPGGLSLLVLNNAEDQAPFWASQVLIRFDADKVSEIRVRYAEGGARKGETLLARLAAGKAGQPESLAAPWAGLWTDLPATKVKPTFYRWQDDLTTRTYQRDAGGSEIVLRERGAAAKPWRFMSRGPQGISLGDERQKIEATFKPVQASGGGTVYQAPSKSPHAVYVVWYANGKADRIVAVSREPSGVLPEEVTKTLKKVWASDLDELGAIRRKDGVRDKIRGSYCWHDDVTRIQTFAQLSDKGAQVLTEWRAWPLPGAVETAKR